MSISGDRIKECRIKSDLTQEDVARQLGIGKQAIYKYETGSVTNIPLQNIYQMSKLFGVSPSYLAGWSDQADAIYTETLTSDEHILIEGYRSLPSDGKSYVLQQVTIARAAYGEKSPDLHSENQRIK